MNQKIKIKAPNAANPLNSSQAVRCGDLVFVSAQTGTIPATGEMADGLDAQTEQMLANLDAVLAAADLTKVNVTTVTLMFSNMGFFKRVDEIYADWVPPRGEIPLPCVNAFACPNLPGGGLVQIDAIAAVPRG